MRKEEAKESGERRCPAGLVSALAAWRGLLGEGGVEEEGEGVKAAAQATFSTVQSVWAILRPRTTEEVQACVRVSREHKIPLYPVSRGKNWGLGSRVPVEDAVLMDLSRMDRILDFDEEMAYVTLEPGVTFQQVYDFLQARGSKLMLAMIGGSPMSSVIGNCVERGDGVGPYGDRESHLCDMEAVLPDGRVIQTGFSRYREGAALAPLTPWVVGPHLTDLFFQSGFGIVTKLTIWLMPKPSFLQVMWMSFRDLAQMQSAVAPLRGLMLRGVIPPTSLALWNLYKLLARGQQYPWEAKGGETPLWPSECGEMHPWYGCAPLYHTSAEEARILRRYLLGKMEGVVEDLRFFDQDRDPEMVEGSLFLGTPTEDNIKSTYWRKRGEPPAQMDPDRDRCGVLWMCHTLPMTGEAVGRFAVLAEEIVLSHGLEPNLGIACSSARAARTFVALMYDREVEGEDAKAMRCHDAIFSALTQAGFLSYRLGLSSMQQMPPCLDATPSLLSQIKQMLDPDDLLAPGRYRF